MKKIILTLASLVIIFSSQNSKAQTWAPDGAEWYYHYQNFWYEGYIHFRVLGDTMIHDTACRIMDRTSVIRNLEFDTTLIHHIGRKYMYGDDDRVYCFANNKFYTLYDFGAAPGDSWVIPQNEDLPFAECNPEGEIIVTDTGSSIINGQHLRRITVEPHGESHWALYGDIIETIGPINSYMLPEPDWYCVVDLFEGGALRCYEDPEFGLYATGLAPYCDYIVNIPEAEENTFKIYPNPCNEVINIEFPNMHIESQLSLFNSAGRMVFNRDIEGSLASIDVSELSSGIYMMLILSGEKEYRHKLLVR